MYRESAFESLMPSEKLMASIASGDEIGVREALAAGANPNFNRSGNPAFMVAVGGGNLEIVKLLYDHGADPNAANRHDWLPVHEAAKSGFADILEFMSGKSMVVMCLPVDGELPIHHAAMGGHADALRVLLKSGARVDAVTADHKKTALMFAIEMQHLDAAKVLVEAGAQPDLPDTDGRTARDRAKGWPTGLELLNNITKITLDAPQKLVIGTGELAPEEKKEEEALTSSMGVTAIKKRGPRP